MSSACCVFFAGLRVFFCVAPKQSAQGQNALRCPVSSAAVADVRRRYFSRAFTVFCRQPPRISVADVHRFPSSSVTDIRRQRSSFSFTRRRRYPSPTFAVLCRRPPQISTASVRCFLSRVAADFPFFYHRAVFPVHFLLKIGPFLHAFPHKRPLFHMKTVEKCISVPSLRCRALEQTAVVFYVEILFWAKFLLHRGCHSVENFFSKPWDMWKTPKGLVKIWKSPYLYAFFSRFLC